jgi:hypothetical protein
MNTTLNLNDIKLSPASRSSRMAIGILLLAIPVAQDGTVGVLSVLPLLAIYPILTSILGFSLIEVLALSKRHDKPQTGLAKLARTNLFLLGTGTLSLLLW